MKTQFTSFRKFIQYVGIVAITALLVGCGGGGGSSSNVTPVTSFQLQSGYKKLIANGASWNLSISGTCTGSGTISTSAPGAATFEGASALSTTETLSTSFTNCTPASHAITALNYYDSNYNPLGFSTVGMDYAVFQTPLPSPLPTSVSVGNTGVFGTLTVYTDSTKTTSTGTRIISWAIESGTTTTAVVNVIGKGYNTSSQLLFTQQTRYSIDASGTLTLISIDVQDSTTSTNHLVFTRI